MNEQNQYQVIFITYIKCYLKIENYIHKLLAQIIIYIIQKKNKLIN